MDFTTLPASKHSRAVGVTNERREQQDGESLGRGCRAKVQTERSVQHNNNTGSSATKPINGSTASSARSRDSLELAAKQRGQLRRSAEVLSAPVNRKMMSRQSLEPVQRRKASAEWNDCMCYFYVFMLSSLLTVKIDFLDKVIIYIYFALTCSSPGCK